MKPASVRLREAMDLRGFSINKLHKVLASRQVRGSSYGSVRNYLGKTDTAIRAATGVPHRCRGGAGGRS
jgi:hypothetical protein